MIAKCTKCQHKWQAVDEVGDCAWCGAPGYKLEDDYMEDEEYFTRVCNEILTSQDQLRDRLAPSVADLVKGLQGWNGRMQDGTLIGQFIELLNTHKTRSKEVYQFIVDYSDVPGFEITAFTIILLTEHYRAVVAKVILWSCVTLTLIAGSLLVLILCL